MRSFTRTLAGGLLLALATAASPAHAVFLEADNIEADGSFSTIDLWFFRFETASTSTFQVNDVTGLVVGSDTDLIVYVDDGTFSTVFASDTTVGAEASIPAMLFPAGSYIAVVANSALSVGEFGPTQPDPALAIGGYEYELNGQVTSGENPVFDCILSGNLGGGYSKQVLNADTCRLPPTAVAEPPALALLAAALFGLGLAVRRYPGRA